MHINDIITPVRGPRDPFGLYNSGPPSGPETENSILMTRQVAYGVIAPIIISAGIAGNILTILILRNPIFKGVMFNFFFALAIFDFLSLVLSISAVMHLLHPVTSSYATAFWYSYLEVLFINSTMGTSVLIVVCITCDRFMSVRFPYKFKIMHTDHYCKLGIAFSLFVAFVVWLPTCFLKRPEVANQCDTFHYTIESENSTLWVACQIIDPSISKWYKTYAWLREVVISFGPIVIVIILNAFLVKYFVEKHKHFRNGPSSSSGIPNNVVSTSRQACDKTLRGLLKAIIISFLITILPAGVFNAAYSENISTNFKYEIFRASANNLELLNHALNFYLYILLSKPIRSALPSMFKSIKNKIFTKFKAPQISFINISKYLKCNPFSTKGETQQKDGPCTAEARGNSKTESRHTRTSDVVTEEYSREILAPEFQRSVSHDPRNDDKDTENVLQGNGSYVNPSLVTEQKEHSQYVQE